MNARHVYKLGLVGILLALGLSFGLYKAFAQSPAPTPPAPANADDGTQVLTRGPVHEAFAEAVTYDPEPGIVATKSPPAAIEEVPPAQRPEGTNVAWIPGYWGWDDERTDFLWVSGVWRALPPGREWVPGYWGKSAQGHQWTSGYWADAKAGEVEYLPEPPATVEVGANVAAPSTDDTWLPGCWVWQTNRYAWRPGFWAAAQQDWVWTPAHYVWAPRGYVFVDGYWDYSIARRGVLFAPVYFGAGVYDRPGFSYSPTAVIDLGVFSNHLFLRPRYQHYYFGDYYGANYRTAGYYPWFAINTGRFGYDPIYAHERWQHRQDVGWDRRIEADFQNRRDHENLRPPHTMAAQGLLTARDATARIGLPRVAGLLNELSIRRDGPQRFQPVDQAERQQFNQRNREVQRAREERQRLDMNAPGTPTRAKRPGSPITAKSGADFGRDNAPPKTFATPNPDPNVVAKPRVNRAPDQTQQRTVDRVPVDQLRTQQQPKAERQAPQHQPKAEQQAQQPHGKEAGGSQQGGDKGKDKDKDKK